MPEEDKRHLRKKERYSHVYINVQVRVGDRWVTVRALDWNDIGLNFFIEHEMPGSTAEFRKGPKRFSGLIVWKRKNDDDAITLETVLNTLLFERLDKIGNTDTRDRIVRLMRAQGRVEEKRKLLSVLDPGALATGKVDLLFQKDKLELPLYRYGILMDSAEWSEIVRNALEITSAVLVMDKIKKGLSGL